MAITIISHPDCLLHEKLHHPECPARLRVIADEFIRSGLDLLVLNQPAPLVTREALLRVHHAEYIDSIFKLADRHQIIDLDPDTYMNQYSLNAVLRAAGAVVHAVDCTLSSTAHAAFCNVRPPGHHAEPAQAMGFCIFNNIAVGVAHALAHYGLQRVAIIDFDAHHGNGTEAIFKDNSRVLLCSSFEYPFYPFRGGTIQSEHILNLPLPAGTNSRTFREAIAAAWLPNIRKFKPEMIFFSAGFDGHRQDPMSNLMLCEEDYAWLTYEIRRIAEACGPVRIVSVLEGGYALEVLGRCVVAHLKALL